MKSMAQGFAVVAPGQILSVFSVSELPFLDASLNV